MNQETPSETKPKKSFFGRLVKWLIILAVISGAFGYVGFRYSLVSLNEFKGWLGEIKIAENAPPQKAIKNNNEVKTPSLLVTVSDPAVTTTPPVTESVPAVPSVQVADKEEIVSLKENQKYFGLYLAARDLRDAKNDPEKFTNELRYFSVVAADNSEIAGKIDILRLSAETGLPTTVKLREGLILLAQNIEKEQAKGFWESIKYSLRNLVKITKIKGEADAASVNEIKLRAIEFLNNGDINGAVREVQKLGSKSDDWVREANNLPRVYEITDYLVDYARNKIKF